MPLRYLKTPLPPRHQPHVHRCRDCANTLTCQDADRCGVRGAFVCPACEDALQELQMNEMARYYEQERTQK